MRLSQILVTGGAGYIGSVVGERLLREGYAVRAFDNLSFGGRALLPLYAYPQFAFVRGDMRDADAVTRALDHVDAVIHLAAIVGDPACAQQPELAQQINYEETCRVATLCKSRGVRRLIFASTCSNYGLSDTATPAREDSPLNPLSLYARTKVQAEYFILQQADDHFEPVILRLSTVFGLSARMRFDLLINEFTRDAVERAKVVVYGEQFWRPYIHTTDVGEVMTRILAAPRETVAAQIFNVGGDAGNFQKRQIVEMICQEVPGVTVERVAQVSDPRDYRVSFVKIERRLGFHLQRSVAQGIREIVDTLRQGVIPDPYDPGYRNSR